VGLDLVCARTVADVTYLANYRIGIEVYSIIFKGNKERKFCRSLSLRCVFQVCLTREASFPTAAIHSAYHYLSLRPQIELIARLRILQGRCDKQYCKKGLLETTYPPAPPPYLTVTVSTQTIDTCVSPSVELISLAPSLLLSAYLLLQLLNMRRDLPKLPRPIHYI
jgi:hypothetical protein